MASSGPVVLASDQTNVPVAQPDVTAAISIAANATTSGQCLMSNGAGTYVFQLTGTWVATVQVQITRDGTNWVNVTNANGAIANLGTGAIVAANISANAIYSLTAPGIAGARLITTAYTSGTITGSAALTAAATPNPAGTGSFGATWSVNLVPKTVGGNAIHTSSITNTVTQVKSSLGQVYGWHIFNPNAATVYVQFFNTANGSVTLGTTTPVISIGIPASGAIQAVWPIGLGFNTAINVAVTTTRAGSTAPASSVDLNIFYT